MATAIEVQQLPEAGARLSAAAVAPPRPMFGDQPRRLERLFHERIAKADVVVAAGELMEVANVKALIPLPIESKHAPELVDGRSFRRWQLPPPVEQTVVAGVLQLPPQAPDRAGTAPQDIGRLGPRELAVNRAQNHFLNLHGSLHSTARIGHGHLPGGYSFHAARSERSFHGYLAGGQITYLRQRRTHAGTRPRTRARFSALFVRGVQAP